MAARSLTSGMGMAGFPAEGELCEVGEEVFVEALALVKMLRRAKAGVPFEVMGWLYGEVVDSETIVVRDVLDMPLVASTVAVDALDPTFQAGMKEALEETERKESLIGWYHSHPGYGPYLSAVDRETQTGLQNLNPKGIAIVIDPVQSVKGRVLLEAFRVMNTHMGSPILALLGFPPLPCPPRHTSSITALAALRAAPDQDKLRAKGLDKSFYKLNSQAHVPAHCMAMVKSLRRGPPPLSFAPISNLQRAKAIEKLDSLLLSLTSDAPASSSKSTAPIMEAARSLISANIGQGIQHFLLRSSTRIHDSATPSRSA